MSIKGVLARLSYDGEWVTIQKEGYGAKYKGRKAIHRSQIIGVKVKPASALFHGYVQVHVAGVIPAPVLRFSLNAGRPPMLDPYSMSIRPSANRALPALQRELDPTSVPPATPPIFTPPSFFHTAEPNRPPPPNGPAVYRQISPPRQPRPARRNYALRIALRIALWSVMTVAGIFEMSAIIMTLTNAWPQQKVASAIGANIFFGGIFALTIWLIFVDQRHPPSR